MTMTTAEYPAGIPPRPYTELAHQADLAQNALHGAGVEYEATEPQFTPIHRLVGRKMLSSIRILAN